MPAIVGDVRINLLSTASIFQLGDTIRLCPYSYVEVYAGPLSFRYRANNAVINDHNNSQYYQAFQNPDLY